MAPTSPNFEVGEVGAMCQQHIKVSLRYFAAERQAPELREGGANLLHLSISEPTL
jgi:hypothetical protein